MTTKKKVWLTIGLVLLVLIGLIAFLYDFLDLRKLFIQLSNYGWYEKGEQIKNFIMGFANCLFSLTSILIYVFLIFRVYSNKIKHNNK